MKKVLILALCLLVGWCVGSAYGQQLLVGYINSADCTAEVVTNGWFCAESDDELYFARGGSWQKLNVVAADVTDLGSLYCALAGCTMSGELVADGGIDAATDLSLLAGNVSALTLDDDSNHSLAATLDAASGNETALSLSYTTSKAAGNDTGLLVNQTDTLSPGTSKLFDFQTGGTSRLYLDTNTAVGLVFFNTDQYKLYQAGGSRFGARGHSGWLFEQHNDSTLATGGIFEFSPSGASTEITASSGTQRYIYSDPRVNQSGTAGYNALEIDVTETATGSGTKNLISLGVGGSPLWTVDNTGQITTGILDAALVTTGTIPADRVGADHIDAATEVAEDVIGLSELDDDANTPVAGDFVTVETGAASVTYTTPNAGTDVTADLEEESHCSEHDSADVDCTGETIVFAADSLDFTEIVQSNTLAGNPALAVDECFLVATATGGGLICEGSTADTNEMLFLTPDLNEADTTHVLVTESATQTLTGKTIDTTNTVTINASDITDLSANSDITADLEEETHASEHDTGGGDALTALSAAILTTGTIPAARVGADHIDSATEVAAGVIGSSELTDNDILEADLKVVDAPADEECLTYEATGGDFEWQACGGGSSDIISEGDSNVEVIDAGTGQVDIDVDGGNVGRWTASGLQIGASDVTDRLLLPISNDPVTPTLAFGDGDSGLFEASDDLLRFANAGTNTWELSTTHSYFNTQAGGFLKSTTGATTAGLGPYRAEDGTGFGRAAANTMTAIANSIEMQRWDPDGNHSMTSVLDAATGNEVAFSLNYTVNKASSGNDTGFKLNMTDTASPGTSNLMDLQVGGSPKWTVDNTGLVTAGTISGGAGISDGTVVEDDLTGTLTFDATDFLDLSGIDSSTTSEGLKLPQHATACATGFAEGQVCWEADANILHIGDSAAFQDFVPAGSISGDGTLTGTGTLEVTEADALETNPADCGANTWATTIAANGDLTCSAISGGAGITDATVAEADLASEDYGDFTCGAGADDCLLDANSVDGNELVTDSVDTTELDDTDTPTAGHLVALDNSTSTRFEYIAVGAGLSHDGDTLTSDGWELVETQTASASATLDFESGLSDATYLHKWVLTNVLPATDAVNLEIRLKLGGAYRSGGAGYEHRQSVSYTSSTTVTEEASTGDGNLILAKNIGNGSTEGIWLGDFRISDPANTTFHKLLQGTASYHYTTASSYAVVESFGVWKGTSATSALAGVRFQFSTGNIASGRISHYRKPLS